MLSMNNFDFCTKDDTCIEDTYKSHCSRGLSLLLLTLVLNNNDNLLLLVGYIIIAMYLPA